MAPIVITEVEILDALKAAGTAPKNAKTVSDICAETGHGDALVRRSLRRLNAEGRLRVHRIERMGIDGRRQWVPAYTILPKVPAKRTR